MTDAQAQRAGHDDHAVGPHETTDDHGGDHGHDDYAHGSARPDGLGCRRGDIR